MDRAEQESPRPGAEAGLRQRNEELAALNRLAKAAAGLHSLQEFCRAATEELATSLGVDVALLMVRQEHVLRVLAMSPAPPSPILAAAPVHRVGECLCGLAAKNRAPIYCLDIHHDCRCTWEECKRAGLRSFAALPLLLGEEVVGVLGVASATQRDFARSAHFLETAAQQLALSIHNARLLEQSRAHLQRLEQEIAERERAQQAASESDRRFRWFVEASPLPIAVLRERRLDYVNEAFRLLLGAPSGEHLIGREALSLVAPESRERVAQYMEARRRNEPAPKLYRATGLRWDGSTYPYECSVAEIHSPGGSLTLVYISDISERVHAEQALQSAHRRLLDTIESLPDATFILDTNQRVTAWNRACERLTGIKAEAMLGRGDQEYAIPFYGERRPMLADLLDLPGTKVAKQYKWVKRVGDRLYGEAFAPHLNQGQGAHLWGVATPLYDNGGKRFGVIEVIRDITDLKLAEGRIRQQAALLEATRDAIFVWGLEQGLEFMNPAAEILVGSTLPEACGRDLAQVFRPRSELALRSALQEVKARGLWTGTLRLLPPEGGEREVDTRWSLVLDDHGRPKSILITGNDITEKKRLEAQYLRAQRLESVGTLASGVAHDLNNILSPIIMGVGLLKTEKLGPEAQGVLDMILDSARRGSDTVKQLLTFARGGGESLRGPVQPLHLVKEIVRLLEQTFPKSIQIYTDLEAHPHTILADPSQLHQVFMNLCVNARDAMPEGGVLFITVANQTLDETATRWHPKARPIPYVVFKVADSGAGIAPEAMDKIFDPFFTTKPLGKGTGLGLATVLGIVESHHGFMLVDSYVGEGATFQVYIPASTPPDSGDAIQASAGVGRGQGETVLVVDDETAILRITSEVLQRAGYRTLTSSNASEAVHLYERYQDQIRVVITDIMMPFGDGRQLITSLVEQNPKLPIIAMSGLATEDFRRETLRRGAIGFIQKPFSAEALLQALCQALQS
jgi:PAS domain S-box-containing protein